MGPSPINPTFGSGGRLGLPFYLGPGSFIFRITQNGEMLEEREVTRPLQRASHRRFVQRWERKLVTTQPATTTPTSAYP
jgi:hypothetical protein